MTLSALRKHYILILPVTALLLSLSGCGFFRTCRSVPQNEYLLKENQLEVTGDKVDEGDMATVIRQQPNLSAVSVPWFKKKGEKRNVHLKFRLFVYNMVDSASVEKGRLHRMERYKRRNLHKKDRQLRINTRRQEKAIHRGDSVYEYKIVKLKDTLSPKPRLKERMKYRFGEAPVIVDSALFGRSKSQLSTYLHKKGYYNETVTAHTDTVKNNSRARKIVHHYEVETGPRYYIDTVMLLTGGNSAVKDAFMKYIRKEQQDSPLNEPFYLFLTGEQTEPMKLPFDQDVLTGYRDKLARYFRNEALYGFSPSNITYEADTTGKDFRVKLKIEFSQRKVVIPAEDSLGTDKTITVAHKIATVDRVYFHFERDEYTTQLDTTTMFVDSFYFASLMKRVKVEGKKNTFYKSTIHKNIFGQYKDSLAPDRFRMAYFTYYVPKYELAKRIDEKGNVDTTKYIPLKPGVVEAQNYLEYTNYYKEYYQERSYSRLSQLGVFSTVRPLVQETYPGSGKLVVHYYLLPYKKHAVGFEPRTTYSNGLLGVNASVNYSNKNLFRSGWIMTTAFSGGFESNPLVFDDDESTGAFSNFSLNTFELGPSLKFDLPGFFPVKVEKMAKRFRPRTVLSTAYNYQKRPDFDRGVFQLNYLWKFYVNKTQVVSIGLPTTSVIKFVAINKSDAFEERLIQQNDKFLANSYSDQLIWEDLKVVYEFDNLDSDRRRRENRRREQAVNKLRVTFTSSFDLAGNTLSAFKKNYDTIMTTTGETRYLMFGVPYSQFGVVDTKFILYYNVTKNKVLAFKLLAGGGVPYGNLPTSLPYDYSFFAGGANDNRGWTTRSLGPGSYQYYLDKNRTATQVGDIRLGSSVELRFGGAGLLKHAFFADLGNIWTLKYDINRVGSQFSKDFYKELGLAVGYGLRLDFGFFILRGDIGFPMTNPALPNGARWIFQSRQPYTDAMNTVYGNPDLYPDDLVHPFKPQLHFGIGLPF